MASAREKIEAEFENIELALADLPKADSLSRLSALELAGAGAIIHNFYNGVENVLKQLSITKGFPIEQGPSWHSNLIETCLSNQTISMATGMMLRKYLAFRHFFSHGYSFDLNAKRMIPLIEKIRETYSSFKRDIEKALKN